MESEEYYSGEEQLHEEQSATNTENSIKIVRTEFLTPRLAATLEKCKISERDTIHLIMVFFEAIALHPALYVINRTSIKSQRNYFREIYFKKNKRKLF